uniref:Retrovirus-related Pol polyprotein from transposon TNT 1-94 n=1 Tax=Tanacetum cinerariifolium TaxID=118510 RepID=A0A6L2NCN0_TANCI|nr:retrovirus-related Pol polyprotein from transposon TNT 1-94 [Tanacetum cinerariifolium]
MKKFKKDIFKQREEINDRVAEMFRHLKELTTNQTPKKVLTGEEARHPVTKHVNSISLIIVEEEKNVKGNEVVDENVMKPDRSDAVVPLKEVDKMNRVENKTESEPVRSANELVEAPSSRNIGYYLKHKINEKLIKGLIENQRFNDSLGGQLNAAPVLEVENFTNWKKSFDDEEDTRSSQEYMNDLEEEYQGRALLAKSKRFFKKGTQWFSSAKATDQTKCHKCGKKGHFARDCWSKTSVPSYQSPFQQNFSIHLSKNLN